MYKQQSQKYHNVVRCRYDRRVYGRGGTALRSPYLLMGRLTGEVTQDYPWNMMLADDVVIWRESRVEEMLRRWMYALKRRIMKVS